MFIFSRNLISVLMLVEQSFGISLNNNKIFISKNGLNLCYANLEDGLYILNTYENISYSTELFKVAKPKSNKRQKIDSDLEAYMWHLRLGHINIDRINRLVKDGPLRELTVETLPVCESYLEGKMTRRPFAAKGQRATQLLELVHSDVCRPFNVQVRGGYEYYVIFIDDYSRYAFTYLMVRKSETSEKFMEFRAEDEKQLVKSLKELRSDRGGEYLDTQFKDCLLENVILS